MIALLRNVIQSVELILQEQRIEVDEIPLCPLSRGEMMVISKLCSKG